MSRSSRPVAAAISNHQVAEGFDELVANRGSGSAAAVCWSVTGTVGASAVVRLSSSQYQSSHAPASIEAAR